MSERDKRQASIGLWVKSTWGEAALYSRKERGLRLLEESLEICRICGIRLEHLSAVINRVYDRPISDLGHEVGGLGVTLLALCESFGISADCCEGVEVGRLLRAPSRDLIANGALKKKEGISAFGEGVK